MMTTVCVEILFPNNWFSRTDCHINRSGSLENKLTGTNQIQYLSKNLLKIINKLGVYNYSFARNTKIIGNISKQYTIYYYDVC